MTKASMPVHKMQTNNLVYSVIIIIIRKVCEVTNKNAVSQYVAVLKFYKINLALPDKANIFI